jgi:hypothetical protein
MAWIIRMAAARIAVVARTTSVTTTYHTETENEKMREEVPHKKIRFSLLPLTMSPIAIVVLIV